jgi:murein DD-endopeptidase MepM/ murein hydrolase activator NlpD
VLGYTKMHTGIDFAAPRGTPIRAAGDGIVKYAAWRGGYGRAIIIKHDNGYETLYAHQTRFARGIRKGVRVRQGQVIGYVGATGRVTGPHLHYEVRKNGKRINPLRVRTAHRIRLKGKELASFRAYRGKIDKLLRTTPVSAPKVAQK